MSTTTLYDACAALLDYVTDALETAGLVVPSRRFVSHGSPVHDFCGASNGQLVVWWEQVAGSVAPPGASGTGNPSVMRFVPGTNVVTFMVELSRCAPDDTLLDDSTIIPSAAALQNAAASAADDGWVLWQVLRIPRAPLFGDLTGGCDVLALDPVLPLVYSGGVYGVLGSLTTQLDYAL